MISRRTFLAAGVAGSAALAAAWWFRNPHGVVHADSATGTLAPMDPQTPAILAAIVPILLQAALPDDQIARNDAIRDTVDNIGRAVQGLPPAAQQELSQLFALLAFAPARIALARVASQWDEASPTEVAAFLDRWRTSGFTLLRSAYDALHQLTFAAWYGNPRSWSTIGYAGPPALTP